MRSKLSFDSQGSGGTRKASEKGLTLKQEILITKVWYDSVKNQT